jgi:hypothetical protein
MIAGSRYPQGGAGGLYFIAIEMAPTQRGRIFLSVINFKEAANGTGLLQHNLPPRS